MPPPYLSAGVWRSIFLRPVIATRANQPATDMQAATNNWSSEWQTYHCHTVVDVAAAWWLSLGIRARELHIPCHAMISHSSWISANQSRLARTDPILVLVVRQAYRTVCRWNRTDETSVTGFHCDCARRRQAIPPIRRSQGQAAGERPMKMLSWSSHNTHVPSLTIHPSTEYHHH